MCSSSAGGAGGGGRPPGPPPARPPPPAPGSFTERSEWNEWVPASSDARGNQMIKREGPPPQPGGRRPLRPGRYNAGVWPDSASPSSPLPLQAPPPPTCAARSKRPSSRGWGEGARSLLRGCRASARAALRGPVGVGGGGRTCGAGGPGSATRLVLPVFWAIAGAQAADAKGASLAAAVRQTFAISHARLCALELSARGAEPQRRIKGESVSSVSPKHCPNVSPKKGRGRMTRNGENTHAQDSYGQAFLFFCQRSFHLPGCPGSGDGRAGRGRSAEGWPRPGAAGAAGRGLPNPAREPSARWRAGQRLGNRRRRGRQRAPRGWCSGAARPLSGPQGTGVTWGVGLCRPRWLSAAPELIKRLFWPREASRRTGWGRVGAACGRGNNQPHSCAGTKPAAQREVNSGRLNGGFKRRHLQARPVVN